MYSKTTEAAEILLKEMILRTLKTIVRTELQQKSGKLVLDERFWTEGIKKEIKNKYEYWKNASHVNKWKEFEGVFDFNVLTENEMKQDFSKYFSISQLQSYLQMTTGCVYAVDGNVWTPVKYVVITKQSPLLHFSTPPIALFSNLIVNEQSISFQPNFIDFSALDKAHEAFQHNVECGFSVNSLLGLAIVLMLKFKKSKDQKLMEQAFSHIQLAKLYCKEKFSDVKFVLEKWNQFSQGNFQVEIPETPNPISFSNYASDDVEKLIYTYNKFSWQNLDKYSARQEGKTLYLFVFLTCLY